MSSDIRVLGRINLARFSTLRLGGTAECLAEAYSEDGLIKAILRGAIPIGGGSNVLFGDVSGLIVLNRTRGIELDGCNIRAESGVNLISLSRFAASNCLKGLEWACGIPGSVGGAAKMNASAFGNCFADRLTRLKVLRGDRGEWLSKSEFKFSYRKGVSDVVLAAEFALNAAPREEIEHNMRELTARRLSSQPKGFSLGSVFKNPQGFGLKSAAYYIEQCGFKGYACHGLKVSDKHANFILNTGGATPKDFLTLTGIIKYSVYRRFGISLENEFEIIGDII